MKISSTNENNYSLQNVDNFKSVLTTSVNVILDKYLNIVVQYLKFAMETLKIKNILYYKFVIVRGLDVVTNVFNHILFYTKNLELTYFHTQKAYYYYIEFMEQITDDQNIFLQMSSRDAITYVYKKTIYDINNDYRKNIETSSENATKFDLLNANINLYKIMLYKLLNNDVFYNYLKNNTYVSKLENVVKKINYFSFGIEKIQILDSFIGILDDKVSDIDSFFELINLVIKKLNKNSELLYKLKEKIKSTELFNDASVEYNDKFINILME